MGNTQSSTSTTNISNEVSVSISNVVNTNVNNEGTCDIDSGGSQDAVFGACSEFDCPGGFTFSQTSKTTLTCLSENKTEVTVQLTNDISTAISNTVQTIMDQIQKGLGNIGDKKHVENKVEINNEITVEITNEISTVINNSFDSVITTNEDKSVTFNGKVTGGDSGECNVTQETVVEALSSQITENIVNVLAANGVITDILNDYNLTVKQSQEGFDLNKFFSDLFSGIQNIWDGIMKNLPGGAISDWLKKLVPIAIVVAIAVAFVTIGGIIAKSLASKGSSDQEAIDGGYNASYSTAAPAYDEF